MGEHRPYKPRVTGSSPVPPTTLSDGLSNTRGRSSVWLERRPVTPEVASSSLVAPAIFHKESSWLPSQLGSCFLTPPRLTAFQTAFSFPATRFPVAENSFKRDHLGVGCLRRQAFECFTNTFEPNPSQIVFSGLRAPVPQNGLDVRSDKEKRGCGP